MARYEIKAKRKQTNEKFTEWAETDCYKRAVEHVAYVEECGFLPALILSDEVKALRRVLGDDENAKELTDTVLDTGLLLPNTVARQIFYLLNNRCRKVSNDMQKRIKDENENGKCSKKKIAIMVAELEGYKAAYECMRKAIAKRYAINLENENEEIQEGNTENV